MAILKFLAFKFSKKANAYLQGVPIFEGSYIFSTEKFVH